MPPPPRRKTRRRLTHFQKIKLKVARAPKYRGQKIRGDYHEDVDILEEGDTSEDETVAPIVARDYETGEELHINKEPRALRFVEDQALMEGLEEDIIESMAKIGKDVDPKYPKRSPKKYGHFYMKSPTLARFLEISQCPPEREQMAQWYLEKNGYDVDRAVRNYFAKEGAPPERGPVDRDGYVFEPKFVRAEEKSFPRVPRPQKPVSKKSKLHRLSSVVGSLEQRCQVDTDGRPSGKVKEMLRTMRHQSLTQLSLMLSDEREAEIRRQRKLAQLRKDVLKGGRKAGERGKRKTWRAPLERVVTAGGAIHYRKPSWALADDQRRVRRAARRMEAHFSRLRDAGRKRIQRVMEDNEMALVGKMSKWGLLR
jgi:hypothetical protein